MESEQRQDQETGGWSSGGGGALVPCVSALNNSEQERCVGVKWIIPPL